MMLDLYLIRHAESEMNPRADLICGRLDEIPLSKNGVRQARCLGRRLKDADVTFNKLFASTAKRAIETAGIVGMHVGYTIDDVEKTPELLELDQGAWANQPRVKIYSPEVLAQINADNWNFRPPNGESQKDVEERMLNFLSSHHLMPEDSQEIIAVVFTHGMAIKCLLRGIMGFSPALTYKVNIDNTAITRLRFTNRGWHLVTVNDTAHLLGEKQLRDQYCFTPQEQ